IHLAIPGMLMLCAEWWTYELGAFLAGLVSQVELGAQAVIYELANIAYMVPIGFSMAGSVRVGNAMGAGDTARAQLSAKVGMSLCLALIIGCSKNTVSYIFTNDECIVLLTAAGCIVRGLGKQKLGAIANLCGYYGVGFPIGVSLMFAAKLGIFGLWIGLLICVLLQSAFFIVLLLKMSWPKATEEVRAAPLALQRSVSFQCGTQTFRRQRWRGVNRSSLLAASAEQPGAVEPRDLGRPTDTDALLEPPCICTVGKPLPLRILVLRRGFTLVLMLSVLAGGLVLNMTLNSGAVLFSSSWSALSLSWASETVFFSSWT
uniref:Solute carrier family 47 member 3 n=1 Tax=Electrophorus electricus TaxID=8005 RepID=A0A4W4DQZ9_ELEEL